MRTAYYVGAGVVILAALAFIRSPNQEPVASVEAPTPQQPAPRGAEHPPRPNADRAAAPILPQPRGTQVDALIKTNDPAKVYAAYRIAAICLDERNDGHLSAAYGRPPQVDAACGDITPGQFDESPHVVGARGAGRRARRRLRLRAGNPRGRRPHA
jgi:hypothetical protein